MSHSHLILSLMQMGWVSSKLPSSAVIGFSPYKIKTDLYIEGKNIKIYDAFPICNVLLWVFLILFIFHHLYLAISQIMSCIIITTCFYLVFVFILRNVEMLYIMLILILVDSLLLLLWHCRLAAINRCRWQ